VKVGKNQKEEDAEEEEFKKIKELRNLFTQQRKVKFNNYLVMLILSFLFLVFAIRGNF